MASQKRGGSIPMTVDIRGHWIDGEGGKDLKMKRRSILYQMAAKIA